MATFVDNHVLIFDLMNGEHDVAIDTLTYYLTSNAQAPAQTDVLLSELTEVSYTDLSTRVAGTPTTNEQNTGDYLLLLPDLVLTAGAATTGPLQWVGLYNASALLLTNPLMCYWDYGSEITLQDTETLTIAYTTSTWTAAFA